MSHEHYGVPCTVRDCRAPDRFVCGSCRLGHHVFAHNQITGRCACECELNVRETKRALAH